ncbi:HAAS domain-containing protein [Petrocella sp. FN5]|uniref:HAAS domain-containing protein n=1 Tax=Petrocella sp. FN5 TaxID=3032002 RepID=UPI0023DB4437|nr:DUF1700 domain-containing protein [Petrocella sp. FN5]MDF1617434.1 DUF1700 domain-containing protein [Petrocella sp. FN5]
MTQSEFLASLDAALTKYNVKDRFRIIAHYKNQLEQVESNPDDLEKTLARFGNPEQLAATYRKKEMTQPVEPVGIKFLKSFFIGMGLLLFNLIFVLGIYAGIWGVIIGFLGGGLGVFFSGIALLFSTFFSLPGVFHLPLLLIEHPVLMGSSGIFLIGLGTFFMILSIWFIKYWCMLTVKYVKWNIQLIRGDRYEK